MHTCAVRYADRERATEEWNFRYGLTARKGGE